MPEYCSVSCTGDTPIGLAIRQAFKRGLRSLSRVDTSNLSYRASTLIRRAPSEISLSRSVPSRPSRPSRPFSLPQPNAPSPSPQEVKCTTESVKSGEEVCEGGKADVNSDMVRQPVATPVESSSPIPSRPTSKPPVNLRPGPVHTWHSLGPEEEVPATVVHSNSTPNPSPKTQSAQLDDDAFLSPETKLLLETWMSVPWCIRMLGTVLYSNEMKLPIGALELVQKNVARREPILFMMHKDTDEESEPTFVSSVPGSDSKASEESSKTSEGEVMSSSESVSDLKDSGASTPVTVPGSDRENSDTDTKSGDPQTEVPSSVSSSVVQTCYDITTVDRYFEIYIDKLEGVDLRLMRLVFGEDWNISLTEGDRQQLHVDSIEKSEETSDPLNVARQSSSPRIRGAITSMLFKKRERELRKTRISTRQEESSLLTAENPSGPENPLSEIGDTDVDEIPESILDLEEDKIMEDTTQGNTTPNVIRKTGWIYSRTEDNVKIDKISFAAVDMWITINFFFAGVEIAPPLITKKSPGPRWGQWLRSKIPLKNLPRETRLYATLYVEKDPGVPIPAAWTGWPLYNWNGYLTDGPFRHNLRRGGRANPLIATAAPAGEDPVVIIGKMPLSPLPIAFHESLLYKPLSSHEHKPVTTNEVPEPPPEEKKELFKILEKDVLSTLTKKEKHFVWHWKDYCLTHNKYLPKVLLSCPWHDPEQVKIAHDLLMELPPLTPTAALELLQSAFADTWVRSFAVECLEKMPDAEIVHYLSQLVQVLKYENHLFSPLSLFLLKRALKNRIIVGHSCFWYLLTESCDPTMATRYGLLLEAYIAGCGTHHRNVCQHQVLMARELQNISARVSSTRNANEKRNLLQAGLRNFQSQLPPVFSLPIDSSVKLSGIILEKCKYLDSNAAPLWLTFSYADKAVPDNYSVIVKSGDDLRQDILTMQMFSIMDTLWKANGMDLGMTLYKVIATSPTSGMIEVVKNSTTAAKIEKDAGGSLQAFSRYPLKRWIEQNNLTTELTNQAIDNFTRSCAGYCVATYVIGIGDRHNDNIMVTKAGHMFHIDFGHFLGNIMKFGFYNRESAPFVFTPSFMHVMGDERGADYLRFMELSTRAYDIVRQNSNIFLNLFHMMLSTGIPQLRTVNDIHYLRQAFSLEQTREKAQRHWANLVIESLNTKTTQINFFLHNLAHPD
eukprot:TRINITY_DN6038_c0_g1_i1.p1 TRINITY_DN6038_c0_g1~~TRINITY_DN6038_c0_g1_i1.p1  ORF type:complete len:1361 (+),score=214.79 TRINITY_DN6038_c0_g1_i1:544-4083(+)